MKKYIILITLLIASIIAYSQPIGSKKQVLEVKGRSLFDSTITVEDGENIVVGSDVGTKIGLDRFAKIGFWGTTPSRRVGGELIDVLATYGITQGPPLGCTISETYMSFNNVTTANATTIKHGLMLRLDGISHHFLDGTGTWTPGVRAGQGLGGDTSGSVYLPDVVTAGTYERVTVTSYGIVTHGYNNSVTPVNYGTTTTVPFDGSAYCYAISGSTGATTFNLPTGTNAAIGTYFVFDDLGLSSSGNNITLDAGTSNFIVGSSSAQTYVISVDGQSTKLRKVTATQWKVE